MTDLTDNDLRQLQRWLSGSAGRSLWFRDDLYQALDLVVEQRKQIEELTKDNKRISDAWGRAVQQDAARAALADLHRRTHGTGCYDPECPLAAVSGLGEQPKEKKP